MGLTGCHSRAARDYHHLHSTFFNLLSSPGSLPTPSTLRSRGWKCRFWDPFRGSWSNTTLSQQNKTWEFHKAQYSRKARILTCGGLQSTEGQIILGGAVCVIFAVLHPPLEKEPPPCSLSINYGCSDSGLIPQEPLPASIVSAPLN